MQLQVLLIYEKKIGYIRGGGEDKKYILFISFYGFPKECEDII